MDSMIPIEDAEMISTLIQSMVDDPNHSLFELRTMQGPVFVKLLSAVKHEERGFVLVADTSPDGEFLLDQDENLHLKVLELLGDDRLVSVDNVSLLQSLIEYFGLELIEQSKILDIVEEAEMTSTSSQAVQDSHEVEEDVPKLDVPIINGWAAVMGGNPDVLDKLGGVKDVPEDAGTEDYL